MIRNLSGALLAVLCLLSNAAAAPAQRPSLDQQIAALVNDPTVSRAHWGILVTTLDGTPLYRLNEAQFFQPASNAKLFTTAAAMALLGPEMTFSTKVVGKLDTKTGTVTGDLVIVGGGDANLSERELPYLSPGSRAKTFQPSPLRYLEAMADQVAAKGVKSVTGDIVGDDTYFPWEPYPSDWAIDDAVWGYGAPVSALTVTDNQLRLKAMPGTNAKGSEPYHPGTVALEQNGVPYYTVDAHVQVSQAGSPSGIQVERAIGSRKLRVYGQMLEGSAPEIEDVAIEDPAEYTAMAFRGMLEARGIAVQGRAKANHLLSHNPKGFLARLHAPGESENIILAGGEEKGTCMMLSGPAEGEVLARHPSPPLGQDVVITNKESQNLHAELLLRHLGRRTLCGNGSTVDGARLVRAFLLNAGLDKDDFVFYDGSGLSGHDLVTPRATAKLLAYATTQPWFAAWKASLPIGGVDGSLTNRFKDAPLKGHVFAKTGTLGEARALSGYLDCASGQTVIFTIMDSTHAPGSSADREIMDRIVAAIAAAH